MRRILKLSLGIILAITLFFGNIPMVPIAEQDMAEVQAAKIKLSKPKLALFVKKSATLKLKGTKKKPKWSSSNKKVALVDKKGKVTAVRKGTATIIAKLGKKKYKCEVIVKNPTISKTALTTYIGNTTTLTVKNAVGTVSWASSNKSVATVSAKGVVKGIAKGTATVTATASGVKLNCKVTVKKIDVTGITLDSSNYKEPFYTDASIVLSAKITPSNASVKEVTWSSSDPTVATVDTKGEVTAVSPGTVTITAAPVDQAKAVAPAKVTLKVTQRPYTPVEGVSITPSGGSVDIGKSIILKAVLSPTYATNKNVTWRSGKPSVATVDEKTGEVTGIKAGIAPITVTTEDGEKTAECVIIVRAIPVTGVSLDQTAVSLNIGESCTLNATVEPGNASNKSLTWSTSDSSVATVNDGNITAKAAGTAKITVKTNDQGKTASATITVEAVKVSGITLDKQDASLEAGDSISLHATITPGNATNKKVVWRSDNTDVATVDSNGKVTAKGPGTALITVTTEDQGKTASAAITVSVKVTGVSLDKKAVTLGLGETCVLTPTVSPANATNKGVTWKSGNTSVATVDDNGNVAAKAYGTATITVRTDDQGKTDSAVITVAPVNVTGIALDKKEMTLKVGETGSLTPTVTPENATNKKVTWTSSDTSVAAVGNDGTVIAKAKGTATVTVKTEDQGKTDSAIITVVSQVTDITITHTPGERYNTPGTLYIGQSDTIKGVVVPESAMDPTVTYTSSDTNILTVNEVGRVVPVNVGGATITVTSVDNPSISKTVDIKVAFSDSYFDLMKVQMFDAENNDRVVFFNTYEDAGKDILTIYGESQELTSLSVDPYYSAVKVSYEDSDLPAYDKILITSYEEKQKKYYIDYTYVSSFTDGIFALGGISSIEANKEYTVDLSDVTDNTVMIYSFTPGETGTYTFASSFAEGNEIDSTATLYNSSKEIILQDPDDDPNFSLSYNLISGQTYYILVTTNDIIFENSKIILTVTK